MLMSEGDCAALSPRGTLVCHTIDPSAGRRPIAVPMPMGNSPGTSLPTAVWIRPAPDSTTGRALMPAKSRCQDSRSEATLSAVMPVDDEFEPWPSML